MSFSEWREYNLADIATFSQGKQVATNNQFLEKSEGMIRFVRIVDFTKDDEPIRYIKDFGPSYHVSSHELVMIRYGSKTAGKVVRGYSGIIANNMFKIDFNKSVKVDLDFAYFLLSNEEVYNMLNRLQSSSTMPAITFGMLSKFRINLPSVNEQKEIAKILLDLDKKIQVNNQINKTLENMAQAIFKQWFVDFEFPNEDGEPYQSSGGEMVESELGMIPKGWEVSIIGKELECILGGTPSRKKGEYWNGDIPWINSGKVNEFRIYSPSEYITKAGLEKSATKLLKRKTTVLAITGATLGQVSLLEINTCANQSVIGIVENERIPHTFIYPYINNCINTIIGHQTGGAQQHINKGNIENTKLLIPNRVVLMQYNEIVAKLYEMISSKCFESETLKTTRDILLPKLMSGEIRVPLDSEGEAS